jgi:aryl-alcohol dehydrogenase-like predicted oxidoreductase
VVVGTKVRLPSAEFGHIADAVATSLEGSLARLRRDWVDIFHLHNAITDAGGEDTLSVRQVLDDVVPAFERLRKQGKTRFLGLTAIGDTTALHRVVVCQGCTIRSLATYGDPSVLRTAYLCHCVSPQTTSLRNTLTANSRALRAVDAASA